MALIALVLLLCRVLFILPFVCLAMCVRFTEHMWKIKDMRLIQLDFFLKLIVKICISIIILRLNYTK